jgi:hypothetical protein
MTPDPRTTDGLPLQGTCATEECPFDKNSSGLCSKCEYEAECGERTKTYHSTGR